MSHEIHEEILKAVLTLMRIRDLYIYPLKSAAGVRVDAAPLDRLGLSGDRRWMLIDAAGRFLSQRELPRMALLRVTAGSGALSVSAPGMSTLTVNVPDGQARVRVTVWRDRCEAVDAGDEAARWMRAFLERECRLVYAPDDILRPVDRAYASGQELVAFADGFPLLLIGQSSLDDLNARLTAKREAPVPMNRFRPNLVVEGAEPYAEDGWRQIVVGPPETAIRLDIVKPCARCAIVPVDQDTGIPGKEPLVTLAEYRRRAGKVYFGQNVLLHGSGHIRVGDTVRVVA